MPALAARGTGKLGWGSLLSSGDFDFITSASFTTQASVSIDNCFSAGYDHYLVMRNLLGSVATADLTIRLRVAGVDASAANYRGQYLTPDGASVSAARYTGYTAFQYIMARTELTSAGFSRTWISSPFGAVRTTGWGDSTYEAFANIRSFMAVEEHDLTTSYDGFSVIPASGTITGSIYVYGLAV